jgi:hypothetical protein
MSAAAAAAAAGAAPTFPAPSVPAPNARPEDVGIHAIDMYFPKQVQTQEHTQERTNNEQTTTGGYNRSTCRPPLLNGGFV